MSDDDLFGVRQLIPPHSRKKKKYYKEKNSLSYGSVHVRHEGVRPRIYTRPQHATAPMSVYATKASKIFFISTYFFFTYVFHGSSRRYARQAIHLAEQGPPLDGGGGPPNFTIVRTNNKNGRKSKRKSTKRTEKRRLQNAPDGFYRLYALYVS